MQQDFVNHNQLIEKVMRVESIVNFKEQCVNIFSRTFFWWAMGQEERSSSTKCWHRISESLGNFPCCHFYWSTSELRPVSVKHPVCVCVKWQCKRKHKSRTMLIGARKVWISSGERLSTIARFIDYAVYVIHKMSPGSEIKRYRKQIHL